MSTISIDSNLGSNQISIHGPFRISKVFHPDYTRVCIRSDINLCISYLYHQQIDDERDSMMVINQKVGGNKRWKSDKFQILTKYLTIEVRKEGNDIQFSKENNLFMLEIFSTVQKEKKALGANPPESLLKKEAECRSTPVMTMDSSIVEERSKSPFSRFKRKTVNKRSSFSSQGCSPAEDKAVEEKKSSPFLKKKIEVPVMDYRLPKLLLENSLLVCGKNNQIKTIPAPERGQMVLLSDSSRGFGWCRLGGLE